MDENKPVEMKEMDKNEAELAGFVDRGTQTVLQDAIRKIVETFAQNDALEDILKYLEDIREILQNSDDRVKEIQQREKQINERLTATETSVRNLLQRIQSMEVQVAQATEKVDLVNQKAEVWEERYRKVESIDEKLTALTQFFSKSPLARIFSRLRMEPQEGPSAEGTSSSAQTQEEME